MKVGMAAANQSARAMADAEMEAHSCGSGGGDYTNSREAPRIGFSSVVEGVMATAKAANQQVRAHLHTQRETFDRSALSNKGGNCAGLFRPFARTCAFILFLRVATALYLFIPELRNWLSSSLFVSMACADQRKALGGGICQVLLLQRTHS